MSPLSVLHINTWGGIGGAFIASNRLHQELLKANVESAYAYGKSVEESDSTLQNADHYYDLADQKNHAIQNFVEFALTKVARKSGLNDITRLSTFDLPKTDFFQRASVLNLHNIHSDFFSYLALPKLTTQKPAVWTLHDMWSFTGHCAYSYECDRWKIGCGQCAYLKEEPQVPRDATRWEWKLKDWAYQRSNLTIVAPSTWLAQQAEQSMLQSFDIHHIPNGIDTQRYRPLDREQCRKELDLPTDKCVLMFAAQSLTNARKGGDLLFEALMDLPAEIKQNSLLLTFGSSDRQQLSKLGIEVKALGYINSDQRKAVAYSAADIFVFPTRADNLPLVLQESMACGTPMVSFAVGGVPDLVRPEVTGLLAEPENVDDLRSQLIHLIQADDERETMRQRCREIAVAEYSIELQCQRYIDLYRKLSA